MNKLLQLKPDAFGELLNSDNAAKMEQFDNKFARFRKRNRFSIRRSSSVDQKVPQGNEKS